MILNYSVTLSDWRSTTASSETPPLFITVGQSVCLTDWLTDWLKVWLSDQMTPSSTFQQAKRLHNSFVVLNTSYFIENILLILQAWIRCWRNLQTGQSCYQWAHKNGLRWPVYSTGENYPHAIAPTHVNGEQMFPENLISVSVMAILRVKRTRRILRTTLWKFTFAWTKHAFKMYDVDVLFSTRMLEITSRVRFQWDVSMNKVSEARETLMLSINSTPLRLFFFSSIVYTPCGSNRERLQCLSMRTWRVLINNMWFT